MSKKKEDLRNHFNKVAFARIDISEAIKTLEEALKNTSEDTTKKYLLQSISILKSTNRKLGKITIKLDKVITQMTIWQKPL